MSTLVKSVIGWGCLFLSKTIKRSTALQQECQSLAVNSLNASRLK